MKKKNRDIWKNLQLFADDADSGQDTSSNDTGNPDDSDSNGKKYTDEDVNKIVERKMAEWQQKQDKKQKDLDEAQKLKNMSDQEKANHELQELKDELNRLKAKDAQSEMLKTARGILSEKNISVSDDLVSLLVSDDAEQTSKAVNSFADAYQKAVNQGVKDALKGGTPTKGEKAGTVTKEDIMKIQNRTERQKMINAHMDLFK